MINLIVSIKEHFDKKQKYHKLFAESDSRVEGWYKGEMLFLLTELKREGKIVDFHREHKIKRRDVNSNYMIDFKIDITSSKSVLVELKAICISQADGTPRNLNFYLGKDHVGLVKDFKKLDKIDCPEEKYVVGFIYHIPSQKEWEAGLEKLNNSYMGWSCISNLSEAGKDYFVSVWENTKKTIC